MQHDHDEVRGRFSESLDSVHRGTLQLGALVLANARRTAEALLEGHLELAQRVVDADDEIDALYVSLEHRVFEIMARQQPVAGDLRFLVSVTRILYEIERSGDLAVNAAKGMLRQDGYMLPADIHSIVARMARNATDVFESGLRALEEMDPDAGERLDREDDAVDDLVGELYAAIGRASGDLGFEVAVELSRVGRYMERIADHAVNIAEHVTFIATGSFPRESEEE